MTSEKHKPKDDLVTAPVLARWLGVSGKTVYELAKAGIVVRAARGLYQLEESVTRYCDHVRQTASQRGGADSLEAMRSQRIRIATAQADALEAKNEELAGNTFTADVVQQGWSDIIRRSRVSVFKCFATICGIWNGGSGSFGFEIRRLSTDVAIVAV